MGLREPKTDTDTGRKLKIYEKRTTGVDTERTLMSGLSETSVVVCRS